MQVCGLDPLVQSCSQVLIFQVQVQVQVLVFQVQVQVLKLRVQVQVPESVSHSQHSIRQNGHSSF